MEEGLKSLHGIRHLWKPKEERLQMGQNQQEFIKIHLVILLKKYFTMAE